MILPAGSLNPPFSMTVKDGDAVPTGLADAAIELVALRGVTELIRQTPDDVDADTGTLTHNWAAEEVADPTDLFWHAEVDFGDGVVFFPQLGELVTRIR